VPVAQISLQPQLGAAHALAVGRLLAPLTREGVLIIGSGHLTHNLQEWFEQARRQQMQSRDAAPADYVLEFRAAVDRAVRSDDAEALAGWPQFPHARRAHPSDEHFLPLLIARAAAGPQAEVERIESGFDGGVLANDLYLFTSRQ
jgi:4,5-DOPA dioxygenase extradiol